MKRSSRSLYVFLAVLIFCAGLISCARDEMLSDILQHTMPSADKDAADSGDNTFSQEDEGSADNDAGSGESEVTASDYTDFVMPPETDTLVVYTTDMLGVTLVPAVEIFRERYPEVTVDIKKYGDDEFNTLIRTEIPSGRGPDLLFSDGNTLPDLYKTMSARLFVDLEPFFLNDPDFSFAGYVNGVTDRLLFDGRRYAVPIEFFAPVVSTSQEALDEAGIPRESLSSYDGFLGALTQYHAVFPEGEPFVYVIGDPNQKDLLFLYKSFAFQLIDYGECTASADDEKLHALADTVKLFYGDKRKITLGEFGPKGTTDRVGLFRAELNAPWSMFMQVYGIIGNGEEPVLLPVPDPYGGMTAEIGSFAAIPEGAKNKRNAFRLLEILLSEELQSGTDGVGASDLRIGLPVNRNALKTVLHREAAYYDEYDWAEEYENKLYEIFAGCTRAVMLPPVLRRYLESELMPYVRGERSWEDCYKRFLNTLELYAGE